MTKSFLLDIHSDPRWPTVVKEMEYFRPVVPKYVWGKEDNTEELKARSLQQDGFDVLFNIIK